MADTGSATFFCEVDISLSNSEGDSESYRLNSYSPNGNTENGGMFFQNLTYVRVGAGGSANTLNLSLIDNTTSGIEDRLMKMYRNMTLSYTGVRQENGKSTTIRHGPYHLMVTDWTTSMTPYGASISLTAISIGKKKITGFLPRIKSDRNYKSISYAGPPHKAVKEVLEACGISTVYNGVSTIEECQSVMTEDKEGEDVNVKKEKAYVYNGGSAEEFIMTKIMPFAKSKDPTHLRGFIFYFMDELSSDGKPIAVFRSTDGLIDEVSKKKSVAFEYNSKNSNVRTWHPVYQGKNLLGICGLKGLYVDKDSGEIGEVIADGSVEPSDESGSYLTIQTNVGKEESQKIADTMFANRVFSAQKASMTLINYTDISVGDYFDVKAFTKEGTIHHTSGNFFVSGVTDSIEGGMITTSLELKLFKPLQDTSVSDSYVRTHN